MTDSTAGMVQITSGDGGAETLPLDGDSLLIVSVADGSVHLNILSATLTLTDVKAHLNITTSDDDALLTRKLAAASQWVLSYTGLTVDTDKPMPEPLNEAILQLVAHFYDDREASGEFPSAVMSLVMPYREWSF